MIKKTIAVIFLSLLILGCKKEAENEGQNNKDKNISASFNTLLDNYYEDGLKLDPISATKSGDMRYNDQFPNTLSEAYTDSLKNYYTFYKAEVAKYDDAALSESEQMSKAILEWKCDINLESLNFRNDELFQIDQM